MFENVDGRTDDGRMDAGVTGILLAHPRAFGSGELKSKPQDFQAASAATDRSSQKLNENLQYLKVDVHITRMLELDDFSWSLLIDKFGSAVVQW